MKSNSKRLTSLVLALLLVVVAFIVFFDLIEPEYGVVEQTKGQIIAEDGVYQTESQAVTAAQKVIDEYQQQQSQGGGMIALALPTNQDLAGAIAQIYGLAQNNSLVVQSLTISAPSLQLQATPAAGASTTAVTNPLGDFSMEISAAGSYENFENFISGVETNVRIFDVKGMTIAPATNIAALGKNVTAADQDFFDYNLTVETYYQTS